MSARACVRARVRLRFRGRVSVCMCVGLCDAKLTHCTPSTPWSNREYRVSTAADRCHELLLTSRYSSCTREYPVSTPWSTREYPLEYSPVPRVDVDEQVLELLLGERHDHRHAVQPARTRKHPRMCARSHTEAGTGRQEGGQAEPKQKDTQACARIHAHKQPPIALNADNQSSGYREIRRKHTDARADTEARSVVATCPKQ